MLGWLRQQTGRWHEARRQRQVAAQQRLKARYHIFRALLASNNRAVDALTDIAILLRLQGDGATLTRRVKGLIGETAEMVERLASLTSGYRGLATVQQRLSREVGATLAELAPPAAVPVCLPLAEADRGQGRLIGNKAAVLAGLRRLAEVRVPDGFVATVAGCRLFLEHQGLSLRLVQQLAKAGEAAAEIPPAVSESIQHLVRQAPLPGELTVSLAAAARPFFERGAALAVRSSSISEDGRRHSFAGQFSSVLNVRSQPELERAFREVVASNFNARSLAYRLHAGLDPLTFDMAVLCLEMVEARAAGILLTRAPQEPASGVMLISAVPGLGEAAVAGSAAADLYLVARDGSVDWPRSTIAEKEKYLASEAAGGIAWRSLPAEERRRATLDAGQIAALVAIGNQLEAREGGAQDIEWAVDREGQPVVLQMRPLTTVGPEEIREWQEQTPPVAVGSRAAGGRATGRVRLVSRREDFAFTPQGPVLLVMHQSLVDAASVLGLAAGVLVDLGSPADHLACVAREYGTPLVCGLKDATRRFGEGEWLTVDGDHGRVYAATAEEITAAGAQWQRHAAVARPAPPPLPPLYRELQERVTALHLTDAYGPTFSILECRSLHDVVRFVHEKAVLAMFEAGDDLLEAGLAVHVIESPVPFWVSVIDMGGGLQPSGPRGKRLPPSAVISQPFQALWRGITTPGLRWGPPPGGAPMGAVMSNWITDQKSERPIGMPNYALVSRDYCNLNARMDFHFIMVDAVCGIDPRSNHIRFRFKGGGTDLGRRRRRAMAIAEIFEHYGFVADVREDLINAALQGAPREAIEEKLVVVGQVLGFTRLLDATMRDDATAHLAARSFIEGDFGLTRLERLLAGEAGPQKEA
ncbi:MAG: PEP/pyruvate-binding domain-containing protein [Thermodesulfobacteriota bacterium]